MCPLCQNEIQSAMLNAINLALKRIGQLLYSNMQSHAAVIGAGGGQSVGPFWQQLGWCIRTYP